MFKKNLTADTFTDRRRSTTTLSASNREVVPVLSGPSGQPEDTEVFRVQSEIFQSNKLKWKKKQNKTIHKKKKSSIPNNGILFWGGGGGIFKCSRCLWRSGKSEDLQSQGFDKICAYSRREENISKNGASETEATTILTLNVKTWF